MNAKTMRILFVVLLVWFAATMIIVYKDIDHPLATKVVIAFVIYVLIYALITSIVAINKIRKKSKKNIKRRIRTFAITFITAVGIILVATLGFKTHEFDLLRTLTTSLGTSLGVAFLDVVFEK